jgi:NCS2 family nucleobase:cation symporter-2/xanthine permease XanP
MSKDQANEADHHLVRYEPEEKAPHLLAAGMGAQIVLLILAGIMMTPIVIARAAGLNEADTSWLVFAALLAAGMSTWLQLMRIGPIGSGYTLFVGSNVAFVSVAVAALQGGGLAMLGTLGALGALATFVFTRWLPLLRKIMTPAVGGTVLMLMALSVGPVIWGMFKQLPPGVPMSPGVALVTLVTLVSMILILMLTKGMLRLWAPLIGVAIGCALAATQGMIDTSRIAGAPWIGLPGRSWPGLAFSFDATFWGLLPAFALISLVACIETYADGISVQRTSRRKQEPIDFRAVQGAINADGVGSVFAGLLGTVPNTVFSTSVAVLELTGVAARRVGFWGGLFLCMLAFSPKIAAAVACIPTQVAGAYILLLVVLIFGHGIRLVNEDGLDFEIGLVVCLGFWIGFAAQERGIFNDIMPTWLQTVYSNGTTVGGVVAILLMLVVARRKGPRERQTVPLDVRSLTILRENVHAFSQRVGWDARAEDRLMLSVEEAVLFLCEAAESHGSKGSRLHMHLSEKNGEIEVELITAPLGQNAEAIAASLHGQDVTDPAENLSIRLLSQITQDLKHLQYQSGDYLNFRVDSAG